MFGYSLFSPSLQKHQIPALISPQDSRFSNSAHRAVRILVRSSHHVQSLTVSRDELATSDRQRCLITGSERVICRDFLLEPRLQFFNAKRPSKDFCCFVESTPQEDIVAFFREIAWELEEKRQLVDFHLKVRDGDNNFKVEVFLGDERPGPELLAPEECISCFSDTPVYPGREPRLEVGECILEEFSDQPHVRCRLDFKGRSGFVIAPVRHVERMSDLKDEELGAMWSVAVRLLRQGGMRFISMVLNHGSYRTLNHLHLKVWVETEVYEQYQMTWSDERKELWRKIQELARTRPRKPQQCFFFKQHNKCRHGDMCSYLHFQ